MLFDECCSFTAGANDHDLPGADGENGLVAWPVTDCDFTMVRIIAAHHDLHSGGKFGAGTIADSGVFC